MMNHSRNALARLLNATDYYASQVSYRLRRAHFRVVARSVLDTAPIELDGTGPIVLSMVQSRDLTAWLLAIKSFAMRIPPSRIVVVADPTLTTADMDLISSHAVGAEIVPASAFQHAALPTGGTWERLQAIARFIKEGYVIQLDADTLSLGTLRHVREAVDTQRGFALVSEDRTRLQTTTEISEQARREYPDDRHVQGRAELILADLALPWLTRYLRGCSGFTGFPKHAFELGRLIEFSNAMEQRLGSVWRTWGSEQVASNIMLANSFLAQSLPHPAYCSPEHYRGNAEFVHFIGYLRFNSFLYASLATRIIGEQRLHNIAVE